MKYILFVGFILTGIGCSNSTPSTICVTPCDVIQDVTYSLDKGAFILNGVFTSGASARLFEDAVEIPVVAKTYKANLYLTPATGSPYLLKTGVIYKFITSRAYGASESTFVLPNTGATYPPCADGVINSGQCTTALNRYVTPSAGGSVVGATASLTAAIPLGFYNGTQMCSMSDANLTAANIKSGVSIFGVAGSINTYSACTDNSLNSGQCTTSLLRYVTSVAGASVNGTNGSLSTNIVQGFYSGAQTATMSDTNLTSGNIKNGATIFGVAGAFAGSLRCKYGINCST